MTTFEIVILALFVGAFTILLIITTGFLIYSLYQHKLALTNFQSSLQSSASQFGKIKEEIKSHLDQTQSAFTKSLAGLSGADLLKATQLLPRAVDRIEKAALAIGSLVLAGQEGSVDDKIAPDAFAPPDASGQSYVSRTSTSTNDDEAIREEFSS